MDINKKIADNTGLIYQQLHRFTLINDPDAESLAYEALYKAVMTYDEASGNSFSTYAVCIIANALRMHLRHLNRKRQLTVISYDEPLSDDEEAKSMLDLLAGNDTAESYVLMKELRGVIDSSIKEVLDSLNDTHRKIIIAWYESDCLMPQREMAKAFGVSQPVVSRAISAFKYRLKMKMEEYL